MFFKSLVLINERSLRFKICDTVGTICENVYESEEEQWNDLINYIYKSLGSELTDENVLEIESALYLLSHIFGYVYDELSKNIDGYVEAFKKYFKSNNLSLKTKTVVAITEILSIVRKKESKKFRDFTFSILETTLQCLDNPKEENNLKVCLTAISDLTNAEPVILRKSFNDLFILMGRITEKKDFTDENIRELAFEIIITMIENSEKLITKDEGKLKVLVEAIYKFGLEMDDDVSEDWLTPKSESFFDEEFVPEEKLATALAIIDRLTLAVGSKVILGLLSDIVLQLLSNATDWRYKYIGFMTIAQMVENVDDIVNIENILPAIFRDAQDTNPKIRYACLYCISQISDHLNPTFQNNYHEKVIPTCLERIKDPVLRVQLQACDSLQTYIEHVSDQIASTYCQSILDVVFGLFLTNIPVSLRESILNLTSELVSACEKNFEPYAEKCLQILLNYFNEILNSHSNKSLYGIFLDTITVIGPKCETAYHKFLPDLINAMVSIQNNIPNLKDPISSYLHNAWERIIPIVKEHYKEAAPKIIESALKLITHVPTMSVSSQPEKKFDIQDLIGSEANSEHNVQIEKKKIQITTSETEELTGCIEMLNIIVETFAEQYLPYVELTQKQLLPLLTYEINDDVRAESSNCLPELIKVIKASSSVENLHAAAKIYVSALVSALEKETDNAVIATFLDNLGEIVEKTGVFLTIPEINLLFGKLLENFDKVEKSRLTLLHKKEKVEEELIKEKENGMDKIDSDDEEEDEDDIVGEIEKDIEDIEEVLTSIADVMGSLFSTHKELSLEIVDKLLQDLLPKYFEEKSSNFEKKMGLFILDDMIEFLGQTLLEKIWPNIHTITVGYTDHKATELRQAACYGVGEFAKHTVKDYNLYANDALNALSKALDINSDGEDDEEWGHARDNAIASLGKIIKFQHNSIDVNNIILKWLNLLPLKYDAKEAANQHDFLCDVVISNSQLVVGENNSNLPRIIRILAKVYDSKNSNDEVDKKILQIFEGIKTNPSLHECVRQAKELVDDKLGKKIAVHFS